LIPVASGYTPDTTGTKIYKLYSYTSAGSVGTVVEAADG